MAAKGNRRNAAKALGLGYTNVVESLRDYGVIERMPSDEQRKQVLEDLASARQIIERLEAEIVSDTK